MIPLLFSYGTLQQENVQLGSFQRRLSGQPDALVGYAQSTVAIDDPDVLKTSGKAHHPIDRHTGAADAHVHGTAFVVSEEELAQADAYE
ncbi:gamma-glutamylcyclotransferase family protein, partial [Dyella sp. ASV21]|uniref:gamma-glutamylcyclotransferase family protein n=1 Tax=Dyella sp. ASV21 TaxID=2795114 RepID=UPI0018EE0DBA